MTGGRPGAGVGPDRVDVEARGLRRGGRAPLTVAALPVFDEAYHAALAANWRATMHHTQREGSHRHRRRVRSTCA